MLRYTNAISSYDKLDEVKCQKMMWRQFVKKFVQEQLAMISISMEDQNYIR